MYADNITASMKAAIEETNRRREKQVAYNKEHGIDPQPLRKKIADITDLIAREVEDTEKIQPGRTSKRSESVSVGLHTKNLASMPRQELMSLIESLTDQMKSAASELQFELAARLRDEIRELKRELRGMEEAGI
jgi:excinuclease ABC subunit B